MELFFAQINCESVHVLDKPIRPELFILARAILAVIGTCRHDNCHPRKMTSLTYQKGTSAQYLIHIRALLFLKMEWVRIK